MAICNIEQVRERFMASRADTLKERVMEHVYNALSDIELANLSDKHKNNVRKELIKEILKKIN